MEYFNEAIITGVLFCIMFMSGLNDDMQTRVLIGYIACGLIVLQLVVSLSLLIRTTLAVSKRNLRLKALTKDLMKQRKRNKGLLVLCRVVRAVNREEERRGLQLAQLIEAQNIQ